MNEKFIQLFATVIEQCLGEHEMQPPFVVRTVGDNGRALMVGINREAELIVLSKHRDNDRFTLPMKVSIVGQNNRTARFVIGRDGSVGRFH
jgi:hypothetical protein